MLQKLRHFLAVKLGTVTAKTCKENGCKDYCGISPSQRFEFYMWDLSKEMKESILSIEEK